MSERDNILDEITKLKAQAQLKSLDTQLNDQQPQGSFGGNALRLFSQGLSFGTADEIEAFAKSLFGEKTYAENRDEIRANIKKFKEDNPILATGLEIGGSLPTAALGGLGLARAGIQGVGKIAGIEGAAYGFGSGEGGLGERLKESAVGGTISAATGKVADKVLPQVTEQAKRLLAEGIPLTPGQRVGGVARDLEQKATSLPVAGDFIQKAEQDVLRSFNRTAMNKALDPIKVKVPQNVDGQEAFAFASNEIDEAYSEIIPKLIIKNATPLRNKIDEITDSLNVPPDLKTIFKNQIENDVLFRIKGNTLSKQNLKDAESALGQKGMDFLKSPDAFQRQLGQAYFNVQTALRKTLSDQNADAAKLQQINKAFRQLLPVQEAVNASIARGGSFTPGQLLRGIKKTDKSKGKRKTAKGQMPMQDFAQESQDVLARTVPDSGTAGRGLGAVLADRFVQNPVGTSTALALTVPTVGLSYGSPLGRSVATSLLTAPRNISRLTAPFVGQTFDAPFLDIPPSTEPPSLNLSPSLLR